MSSPEENVVRGTWMLRSVSSGGSDLFQRLKARGLRQTLARVSVLEVLQASDRCLGAEDVYEQMLAREVTVSIGAVYRVLSELTSRALLRQEWSRGRKALYSIRPPRQDEPPLRLTCAGCGRSVTLPDSRLHAQLIEAAQSAGLRLAGRAATIQVECEHEAGSRCD